MQFTIEGDLQARKHRISFSLPAMYGKPASVGCVHGQRLDPA